MATTLFLFFSRLPVLVSPLRPSSSEKRTVPDKDQGRVDGLELIEHMNELLFADEGTDKGSHDRVDAKPPIGFSISLTATATPHGGYVPRPTSWQQVVVVNSLML
jgi:hypothetical protein